MDPKQNTHIQPAAEHTPLDEAAARLLKDTGGAVAHPEQDDEQHAQHATTVLGQTSTTVDEGQLQQAPTPAPAQEKQTLLDVLVDMLTLKWFKKNMRNKYGEDINKIREVRQAERTAHLQKPVQTYTPPSPQVVQNPQPNAPQPQVSPPQNVQPPQSMPSSVPPSPSQGAPENSQISNGQAIQNTQT